MASPCIGANAAQPPSAKAGLMVTPSSVTLQVSAREPVAMNLARDRGGLAERLVDFFPIDLLSLRGAGECRRGQDRDDIDGTHA